MAKSKGQAKGRGHSHGPGGHGGIHHKGGSVNATPSAPPGQDHMANSNMSTPPGMAAMGQLMGEGR